MIIKKINLDTWQANYATVYVNRGEVDSRYIEVSFKDQNKKNIDLLNKAVTFYAVKPDGSKILTSCSVNSSSNTATVKLTSQTLSCAGILDCEFQIFNGENVLLKVNGLKIIVSSTNDFSEAIESTSEFNTLIECINTAKNFSNTAIRGIKVNGTPLIKDDNNIVDLITSSHNIPIFSQGVWTPSLISWGGTSPVYSSNYASGKYIRIANLVYITFYMNANITTPGTLNAHISGLPFEGLTDTIQQAIAVSEANGGGLSADTVLSVVNGSTYIKVSKLPVGDQIWNTTGNLYISGSGCYLAQNIN